MAPSLAEGGSMVQEEAFAGAGARTMLWEAKARHARAVDAPVPDAKPEGVWGDNVSESISNGSDHDNAEGQRWANFEFDDGVESSSSLTDGVELSSPCAKDAQEVGSAATDAVGEEGSDGASLSLSERSDFGHSEARRWANMEFDDEEATCPEVPHSVANSVLYSDELLSFEWDPTIQCDDDPEEAHLWQSEMHGWHWVPVAVVPMPWATESMDGTYFSQGHGGMSDPSGDSQELAMDPKGRQEVSTATKKAGNQTARKRAKKQAAGNKRSPKTASSQANTEKPKAAGEREPTTIMIRSIPQGCTRDMVQAMFDAEGFEGQYDFLYLPYSFDDWSILGHAFVNFVEHRDAERAVAALDGRPLWPGFREAKACEVCWSKALKGLEPCIGRFRNSPVMHRSVSDEYKPMLLRHGRRCAFPEPTKQIQAVKRSIPEIPQ